MSPNKLRQIIIARIESGESKTSIAKAMGVHINTVHKAWRAYQERGTTNDLPRTGRPVGESRRSIVQSVRERVDEDPNVSIRALAREFGVAEATMRRVVKVDLGLKSLAVLQVQQLTPSQIEKRLVMSTFMLNWLKGEHGWKKLVFSDEKDFHLNKHLNRRNNRTMAPSSKDVKPSNRYQGRPKFAKKALLVLRLRGQRRHCLPRPVDRGEPEWPQVQADVDQARLAHAGEDVQQEQLCVGPGWGALPHINSSLCPQ